MDEPVNDNQPFRTKDLNQAAFIWCQPGARLVDASGVSTNRGKGTSIYFLFELDMSAEELQALQMKYANGETTVEPQMFVSKQNNLRDLLHNSLGIANRREESK